MTCKYIILYINIIYGSISTTPYYNSIDIGDIDNMTFTVQYSLDEIREGGVFYGRDDLQYSILDREYMMNKVI